MMSLKILNSVLMLVVIIETSTVPPPVARYSRSHRLSKGNDKSFASTISCVSNFNRKYRFQVHPRKYNKTF